MIPLVLNLMVKYSHVSKCSLYNKGAEWVILSNACHTYPLVQPPKIVHECSIRITGKAVNSSMTGLFN